MVVNCGLKVLIWEACRVLEEFEFKQTQPPTVVGLGLGLSLAKICFYILLIKVNNFAFDENGQK